MYQTILDILNIQTGTGYSYNSTVIQICGVVLVLFFVWALDWIGRLFARIFH